MANELLLGPSITECTTGDIFRELVNRFPDGVLMGVMRDEIKYTLRFSGTLPVLRNLTCIATQEVEECEED